MGLNGTQWDSWVLNGTQWDLRGLKRTQGGTRGSMGLIRLSETQLNSWRFSLRLIFTLMSLINLHSLVKLSFKETEKWIKVALLMEGSNFNVLSFWSSVELNIHSSNMNWFLVIGLINTLCPSLSKQKIGYSSSMNMFKSFRLMMCRTPSYRTSNELVHHFSNIKWIWMCSSIGDRTR